MKIYKFFLKSKDDDKLYAFTNNKDYRDIFIGMRNMDIFIYEVEKMNKHEYDKFHKRYLTCDLFEPKECKIVCTGTEYDYMIDDARFRVNEDLIGYAVYDPNIFKTEYYKALSIIMYNIIYEVSVDDDSYISDFVNPNIFHSFYMNFKNTFKRR